MGTRITALFDRLWERSQPIPWSGCYVWMGYVSPDGYVSIARPLKAGKRDVTSLQRASYEALVGRVPDGYHVDHKCRTPTCWRPDHLEAVPPRENILRGIGPSAKNARKTHCVVGHALSGDNLLTNPRGNRVCRSCQNRRKRDSDARIRSIAQEPK